MDAEYLALSNAMLKFADDLRHAASEWNGPAGGRRVHPKALAATFEYLAKALTLHVNQVNQRALRVAAASLLTGTITEEHLCKPNS